MMIQDSPQAIHIFRQPRRRLLSMKEDLETIAKAIELARLRLVNLKEKCPDDAEKQNAIDDAEQGLGWVAKRLRKLEEKK
jgi:hypothetical protein